MNSVYTRKFEIVEVFGDLFVAKHHKFLYYLICVETRLRLHVYNSVIDRDMTVAHVEIYTPAFVSFRRQRKLQQPHVFDFADELFVFLSDLFISVEDSLYGGVRHPFSRFYHAFTDFSVHDVARRSYLHNA